MSLTFTDTDLEAWLDDPGVVPRLVRLIQRLRTSTARTNNPAEDFGFQGVESMLVLRPTIVKPSGRAFQQLDSEVCIEFNKSYFDGVVIESKRSGQDEWRRLAINSFSPYVDSRPLVQAGKPEVREYRLRFLMRDEPVGEWSDILIATASA